MELSGISTDGAIIPAPILIICTAYRSPKLEWHDRMKALTSRINLHKDTPWLLTSSWSYFLQFGQTKIVFDENT